MNNTKYFLDEEFHKAEISANKFNLWFLGVLTLTAILSIILNVIGIFGGDNTLMISTMSAASVFFLLPIMIYLVHDKLLKKTPSFLYKPIFKYFVLVCVFIGITITCMMLSFHMILGMIIPALIAAQYRYFKKLSNTVLIVTIIMVPLVAYGSLYLGVYDRNLMKNIITEEEALIIANRFNAIPAKRLFEIFTHHILPRMLLVVLLDILIMEITRRNNRMLTTQAELNKEVQDNLQKLSDMQNTVIEELAEVIESRDVSTGEHVKRTKKYVSIIANRLKQTDKYKDILTDYEISEMVSAAALHDIGKITVSDTILLKPAKLTDEEFAKMKTHTTKGGEMINNIFVKFENEELVKNAYDIAIAHHEKWNGTGYPNHLKGEEIPLSARIMAIADVFDALVSIRVYKEAMDPNAAFDLIVSEAGTHFDPFIIQEIIPIKDIIINASKESL